MLCAKALSAKSFRFSDEIYQYKGYDRKNLRVLISLDANQSGNIRKVSHSGLPSFLGEVLWEREGILFKFWTQQSNLVDTFLIGTLPCRHSLVGGRIGWTVREFAPAAQTLMY